MITVKITAMITPTSLTTKTTALSITQIHIILSFYGYHNITISALERQKERQENNYVDRMIDNNDSIATQHGQQQI